MIEGVVAHHIVDTVRPPHTNRTAWCCLNHPCDSRPKQLVRHSTHDCPGCSGNTHYIALRPRATESAFAVSSQFCENTFITHIITEPPTYTSIIVLSPLDSSVPNQARLLSHSACFIGKLSNRTILEHHHKLNSPSAHVCMQQSLTNAVTYYLPCTQIRSIPVHYAHPSLSRRQCRKLQRTILLRTTNRHECRHPLPYSSLRSSPVNYAPPAL